MTTVHALIVGASGYGKSQFELRALVEATMTRDTAIILLDPHGTLAQDFLMHLAERHQLHRVIYDRLADTDLIPSYDWLTPSASPNPYTRLTQNDDKIRKFIALLIRRGGLKDTSGTPTIEAGLLNALRLYIHQDTPVPLHWLAHLYTPGGGVLDYMVKHCTEPDTKLQMERLLLMNGPTREKESGPADRRLRAILMSPAFVLRCSGASFDFDAHLANKGILILDGYDCNPDSVSVMMSAITLKTIDFCKRTSNKVQITIDEALNANLLGLQESQALAEVRKFNLTFRILLQTLTFPDPLITTNVLQNCDRHYWFRQGDPESAELAAKDVAIVILDAMKVHHTEWKKRQVDDGYRHIQTTSSSKSKDEKGKVVGKSSNTSESFLHKTKEVTEGQDRYTSYSDQQMDVQQKLMKLGKGWWFERGQTEPQWREMLKEICQHLHSITGGLSSEAVEKLKATKLQRAIDTVKSSSAYKIPVIIPPPEPPPTDDKKKPWNPNNPPAPSAAQRMKGGRGTK